MTDVLVAHQRQNASSCLCGWSELGKSHPEHQAAALSAAGFGPVQEARAEALEAAADAWREYLPAVAGYGVVQPVPVWLERRADWLCARAVAERGRQ